MIRPVVGVSSLSNNLINVDFPDPLSPTTNTNSPLLICRLTPERAGAPVEYDLLTSSSTIICSDSALFFLLKCLLLSLVFKKSTYP